MNSGPGTDDAAHPGAVAAPAEHLLDYPFERLSALDPSETYAELRATCPVARVAMPSGDRAYLVCAHDDVRTVLSSPRFSRAATMEPGAPRLAAAPQRFKSLLNMDPPEHSRVRRLVAREFSARRIASLRPLIQKHTDALLDAMEAQDPPVDLVRTLSFPLPIAVICELLGVPFADRDRFTGWSEAFVSTTGLPALEVLAAQAALRDYMTGLVEAKRARPGEDLMSALVQVHDQGDGGLDGEELVFLGVSLLVAGHETTANQISNSVFALLTRHGGARARFADPEGARRAVEELLRLYPPGDEALLRIAVADVELGDGTVVPAGSAVLPSVGSANRDGAQFAEPDAFDADRAAGHLSFGHGIHFCVGAGLARAELEIALSTLLRRFPGLRLAEDAAAATRPAGRLVHGVSSLRVAW